MAALLPGCAVLCVLLLGWLVVRPAPAPVVAPKTPEPLLAAPLSPIESAALAQLEALSERITALESEADGGRVSVAKFEKAMTILADNQAKLRLLIIENAR